MINQNIIIYYGFDYVLITNTDGEDLLEVQQEMTLEYVSKLKKTYENLGYIIVDTINTELPVGT